MDDFTLGINFIHFGCWNNGLCSLNLDSDIDSIDNGLTRTMKLLKNTTKKYNNITDVIIAGDNYYPRKSTSEIDGKKKKQKIYTDSYFKSGFQCLHDALNLSINNNINKYILLGNHELDDVISYINTHDLNNNSSPETNSNRYKKNKEQCYPLNQQLSIIQKYNIENKANIHFFNNVMHFKPSNTNTLIIMIDSTLYEIDKSRNNNDGKIKYSDIQCYKLLDIGKITDIDINNESSNDMINNYLNMMIEKQRLDVLNIIQDIEHKDKISNIIFACHHPIVSVRSKDREILQEIINQLYCHPDILHLLTGKNIYHLCADTHLYQNGIINIPMNDDEKTTFSINQFIVGTGGAELDDIDTSINNENNITFVNPINSINPIKYTIDIHDNKQMSTHGFLLVNLNGDNVNCKFINAGKLEGSGKKKDKKNKTKKQNIASSSSGGGFKIITKQHGKNRTKRNKFL